MIGDILHRLVEPLERYAKFDIGDLTHPSHLVAVPAIAAIVLLENVIDVVDVIESRFVRVDDHT